MAAASRSASRRTTPKPASRTKRSTRSQSREPAADDPPPQGHTRTTRRTSRSASAEINRELPSAIRKDAKTRRTKGPGLNPVTEDSVDRSSPKLNTVDPATSNQETNETNRVAVVPVSPGAVSRYSGTTALSQIAEEAVELDPLFIVESLSDLWTEASRVLNRIIPSPDALAEQQFRTIQNLKLPGTATGRMLNRALESLKRLVEDPFHSDNNSYVDYNVVLRCLFGDAFTAVPHESRPDDMIFKANLAIFAADILLSERDSSKTSERLQSLDLEFPKLFIFSFQNPKSNSLTIKPGSSILIKETFELALNVRTQNAIMLLESQQHQSSFDPNHVLAQEFLIEPLQAYGTEIAYNKALERASIRGWQIERLRENDDSLQNQFHSAVTERLKIIREYISSDPDDLVNFDGLQARFPWKDFILGAAKWVGRRHEEIEDCVGQLGGVFSVIEQISTHRQIRTARGGYADPVFSSPKLQSRANAATQPLPDRPKATPASTFASTGAVGDGRRRIGGKKFKGKGTIAAFSRQVSKRKSLESTLAKQALTAENPVPEEEQPAIEIFEDEEQPPIDDKTEGQDSVEPERLQGQTAREKATRFHQSQANQDEENLVQAQGVDARASSEEIRPAFIDRQANAVRIAFDDPSQGTSQAVVRSSGNSKRPHVEDNEEQDTADPTQDVGFQEDSRSRADAMLRRLELPQSSRSLFVESRPRKRQRSNQLSIQEIGDPNWQPTVEDVEQEQADQDEDEEILPIVSQQPAGQSAYRATAELARQMTAALPRPPQSRRKWTIEEETRLIELVGQFGTSYAQIQKTDSESTELLTGRDQVALKDKCRTMRFNYHKARQNLPRGFENVPLKTAQKQYLDELDIEY